MKPNEENNLTIVLEEKSTLSEVVVRSSVRKESTSALLNFQKNNTSVSSGIAADFIRRTPDRNTGEILKRVSGTSIQDNKFVVVRGLGDRYNTAFLNGAQLPSSEPDRKSFSFDVIPASVVDNIVINKTATPDLTGEFAGGKMFLQKTFFQLGLLLVITPIQHLKISTVTSAARPTGPASAITGEIYRLAFLLTALNTPEQTKILFP